MASDSYGYLVVSQDLADGTLESLHFRSVGYPWLLVLTGSAEEPTRALFVVSLGLHFLAVALGAGCLRNLGLPLVLRLVFVALASLPPFVQSSALVLTENLSQFLLVLAFVLLLRGIRSEASRWVAAAGLVLGWSALVRPTFQALAPSLGLALLLLPPILSGRRPGRRDWRAAAWLVAASSLVLLATATWNQIRFDHFGISPGNLGYSLSTKTVRVLERLPERYAAEREALIRARDQHLVERGSSHTAEQYLPQAKPELRRVSGLEGVELEALILELNLLLIREAPLTYLIEVFKSVPGYLFPVANSFSTGGSPALFLVWAGLHFAILGFFLLQAVVLAGVTLLRLTRRIRARRQGLPHPDLGISPQVLSAYLLAATIIVYTMFISCVVHHGESRFRVPTDLLILMTALLGARLWWTLAAPSEAST